VTPIRVYNLRSTWASSALEASVDIKVVSERLGHSDVRFTLQVYVRTVESQHRKAALGTQARYGSKPDLTSKIIDVKAKPAKKKQALPRAQKALPEKASATKLPPEGK
jgi:integrase